MGLVSTTFKLTGKIDGEAKSRFASIIERHRPKMNKVIEQARILARDLKRIEDILRSKDR